MIRSTLYPLPVYRNDLFQITKPTTAFSHSLPIIGQLRSAANNDYFCTQQYSVMNSIVGFSKSLLHRGGAIGALYYANVIDRVRGCKLICEIEFFRGR